MTCKDCLHYGVCYIVEIYGDEEANVDGVETDCKQFEDRSRYVVREKGEWVVGGHCNHKPCRMKDTNKWTIYRCSMCGYSNGRKKSANFCPNCGADMRKEKPEA